MARTIGIWVFGLLGSGIAGGLIAVAMIEPVFQNQLFTAACGVLSGLCAFACLRLWTGDA
jgi:hypothetical protein